MFCIYLDVPNELPYCDPSSNPQPPKKSYGKNNIGKRDYFVGGSLFDSFRVYYPIGRFRV